MTASRPSPLTEPVALSTASQVGEARRAVVALCGRLSPDETATTSKALSAEERAGLSL